MFWSYLGRHLHAVLLHGHDGLRDLDVDRLDDRFDVEGSLQPVGHQEHGVCHNTDKTCQLREMKPARESPLL